MTKFILIYTTVNHERPSFDRYWPRTVHDFTTDWSSLNELYIWILVIDLGKIGNFWLNKGTVLRVRLCKITQLLTDFFQNNFPVGSFVKMTFEEKKDEMKKVVSISLKINLTNEKKIRRNTIKYLIKWKYREMQFV